VSFYRSLLTSLATAIVALGVLVMTLTYVTSQRAVRHLSGSVLEQNTARMEAQLDRFFAPATRRLHLLASWGTAGLVPFDDSAAMTRLFVPLLQADPHLSAVLLGDDRGREHAVFHLGTTWRSRQMLRDRREGRAIITEWSDDRPVRTSTWTDLDYDSRQRPWYLGAVDLARAPRRDDARGPAPVYWTEPYVFFTTAAPGITASMSFRGPDGIVRVAGFDLLLADISAFTTALHPGTNGKVIVLTADGRVVGLPNDARFHDPASRPQFLLKRPEDLDLPVVAKAVETLSSRPSDDRRPLRLTAAAQPWWIAQRWFSLGPTRQLAMVVIVPESDLVGNMRYLQIGTLVLMLAGLGVAIVRAAQLARRYSEPIEALARDSERMSRGDLAPGPAIISPIAEVTRLVDAHERMRIGLGTLLKLERDLQLARRIQQDTFPTALPTLAGFEIDAWNEPAEETGGDTYDVIGYDRPDGQRTPRLSRSDAERAVLLLADATGHGIGPALSVTEVRAMLRMAVRAGEDLPAIVAHLNAQLCADLSEGRFVSAWLGELDARDATLRTFSCGQGPILHYRAHDRGCEILETDAVPLGLMEDLDIRMRPPIAMEPGDVFIVASDGIVETTDAAGAAFGSKRLIDLVVQHHEASASDILRILRAELNTFAGTGAPEDDRTVIVIKRTRPS